MEAKIVVASAMHEEIDEVISCLENLARPGTTVIFLVRYPLEFWPYLRDHWVTTESARTATARGREIMAAYSWETQRKLAERKFATLRQALAKKGIEVEVNCYTGSLKAALLKYGGDPKVFWIVRPTSIGRLFGRFPGRMVALFRSTQPAPSRSLFRVAQRRGSRKQTA